MYNMYTRKMIDMKRIQNVYLTSVQRLTYRELNSGQVTLLKDIPFFLLFVHVKFSYTIKDWTTQFI